MYVCCRKSFVFEIGARSLAPQTVVPMLMFLSWRVCEDNKSISGAGAQEPKTKTKNKVNLLRSAILVKGFALPRDTPSQGRYEQCFPTAPYPILYI
jgi:hypothetical protein